MRTFDRMHSALVRKGVIAALGLLFAIAGSIAACSAHPTYGYRYRLSLSFQVDGVERSGSSVIDVRWKGQPNIPGAGPFQPTVKGQGVFVDLADKGAIVAAFATPQAASSSTTAYWPNGVSMLFLAALAFGNRQTHGELPRLSELTGRKDLTPDNMPRLIWFSDIRNPKSARQIKAADIPSLFGPDARLVHASVEITQDPVVIDIDRKIPWFNELKKPLSAIEVRSGLILTKDIFLSE